MKWFSVGKVPESTPELAAHCRFVGKITGFVVLLFAAGGYYLYLLGGVDGTILCPFLVVLLVFGTEAVGAQFREAALHERIMELEGRIRAAPPGEEGTAQE